MIVQDCFLECEKIKVNSVKYKCLSCKKDYSNKPHKELKTGFKNTFEFFNDDFNKVVLLLRKGVYPYEYMDEWEKFNETSSPEKFAWHAALKGTRVDVELLTNIDMLLFLRARSLVVSDLRSVTKGSRFEPGCQLCAEVSSLQ